MTTLQRTSVDFLPSPSSVVPVQSTFRAAPVNTSAPP